MNQWHSLSVKDAIQKLNTHEKKGLTKNQAQTNRTQYGNNQITKQKKTSLLYRFLIQFHAPFLYILNISGVISALLGEWVDAFAIWGVVLIGAISSFIQEAKASAAIEALSNMIVTYAKIIRDGQVLVVDAKELVPGDIVYLEEGNKVPADLRLIEANELKIDESMLTGESFPILKLSDGILPETTTLGDRLNMAYMSTLVLGGSGLGIVVSTGDRTEVGQIAQMMGQVADIQTPLMQKLAQFSNTLLRIIGGLTIITFIAGLLYKKSIAEMFITSVSIVVGAIPEALPAAFAIIIAIGVSRMAKNKAIIRNFPAVETLGSTTVICTDKTGTLTQNKLSVTDIITIDGNFKLNGDIEKSAALKECLIAGLLCNDANVIKEDGGYHVKGDPTEGALIIAAYAYGLTDYKLERLKTIPFNSSNQYMATLHEGNVMYVKGSAEALFPKCINALSKSGEYVPFDQAELLDIIDTLARSGKRILVMAKKDNVENLDAIDGLTFLGLQAMQDVIKESSKEAIKSCQTAGVQVKMVTGDHAVTAVAIAKELGLNNAEKVMTGSELEAIDDARLAKIINDIAIFARVIPKQKLRIIDALQKNGHIVAMTGDGVNDAPALRQANIGVAMGIMGTDVAKEASDMVILDDNFLTLEKAVEEGRCVFDNLTKFINWTIPAHMALGVILIVAIILNTRIPILPIQILWINMISALLLGLMLSFEQKSKDIMTRPPIAPKKPIFTRFLKIRLCVVGFLLSFFAYHLFFWVLARTNNIDMAHTAAMNTFIVCQAAYLFNCRSLNGNVRFFGNKWIFIGIFLMFVTQCFITYNPLMNYLFQTQPIGFRDWLYMVGYGFLSFCIIKIADKIAVRF